MRYHLTPFRMANINNSGNNVDKDVGEDAEKEDLFCTAGGDASWCSHSGNSMEVPQKIKSRTTL